MKKIKTIVCKELGYNINKSLFFHNQLKRALLDVSLKKHNKLTSIQQKYAYIGSYFYKVYVNERPQEIRITVDLCVDWNELVDVYKNSCLPLSHITKRKIGIENIEDWIHCITHPKITERQFEQDIQFTLEPVTFECPNEYLEKFKAITRDIRKEGVEEARLYYQKYNEKKALKELNS